MLRKSSLEPASALVPQPLIIPTMAAAHAEYGRMVERVATLSADHGALRRERKALEAEIAADTTPAIRPSVAALLGDEPSPGQENRKRLAEVRAEIADIDSALVIADRRKREFETAASRAVCSAVRPEVEKRMAALLHALRDVDAAHLALNEVVESIEAEGASVGTLGPIRPHFLGSAREPTRHIVQFTRAAAEAGYVG